MKARPKAWHDREALRVNGQFWTPPWVGDAMAAFVLGAGARRVFDPAVGGGAFFQALRRAGAPGLSLSGCEIDSAALEQAAAAGVVPSDLAGVAIKDFLSQPPAKDLEAVIANPPYVRHHRVPAARKTYLRRMIATLGGPHLDGRAGLHVYFLVFALARLKPGGRLAFIVPADTCEGVFAQALWAWIGRKFRVDAVVTFAPEATPFPGVDTNALVLLVSANPPAESIPWVRVRQGGDATLAEWVRARMPDCAAGPLEVQRRNLAEALATGLSRPPASHNGDEVPLGRLVRVMRGIATGANDFFWLTRARADELQIPPEFLRPCVGRTRDVNDLVLTPESLDALDAQGRPTLLLSPDGRPLRAFPRPLAQYLEQGAGEGLPGRALISTRNPWYRMEHREPPEFLFAYLGRRNVRFIRNDAGVVPLTGFLCVYPRPHWRDSREALWSLLSGPEVAQALPRVGKSYGGGAIKIEPRALESLPLTAEALERHGLAERGDSQATLFANATGCCHSNK
jgi:adenine-specific DNA-methyltransferase